ncbi:MAG TPA: CDP-alcohol phosphatidyltransferase family protein [Variovorax sp.]
MEADLKTLPVPHGDAAPAMPAQRAAALRRDAVRAALPCLLALTVAASAQAFGAGLGPWFCVQAVAVFGLVFAGVLQALPAHSPHTRFGAANRLTLVRLALIALLAAGVGAQPVQADALAWWTIVVATLAALLDALDGPLARAQGLASAFGARFDMECDALLVLVLSLLVVGFGKAGAWVLAAGLMRYAFVLAGMAWPWIARPLAPSLRRKTVCVVQITGLIVCLGPVIALPWSRAIAALSLAALSASFAADLAWLAARRPRRSATLPAQPRR